MFSRGEPTFSFLFKRGQINSSSFSPHSYLLDPRSRHQHHPQVALPFALQSGFSFSYRSKLGSKNKKKEKRKKMNTLGSGPTNPDTPLYWYHPLYFPYFLYYIRAHACKRSLNRITYCPIPNSKLVTINTVVFSPLLFYHPSNHTPSSYEQIIRTKSYAQIICTNIDQ